MILKKVPVLVLVLAWLTWVVPASAEPILYSFTATLTVSKTTEGDVGGDPPATPFEDAHWFPALHHGQTYQTTGWIEYDPSLFLEDPSTSTPMVFVDLDQWTFGISSSLGFVFADGVAPDPDTVMFVDTAPAVVSGPMPGSFFFGEDAVARFFNPLGTSTFPEMPPNLDEFTTGSLLYFGSGIYEDPIDGHITQTRLGWQGTIESVHRVPEPATLSLLFLGVIAVRARWRRSSSATPL